MQSPSIDDVKLCLLWGEYDFSWPALRKRLAATALAERAVVVPQATTRAMERVLRRVCRRATLADREDAVRWLLSWGPLATPVAVDESMAARATEDLVGGIVRSFPAMPRREMQELVRRGESAMPALLAALRRTRDPRRLLWCVVTIGAVGAGEALGALAALLRHPSPELAAAAAEGLARIGPLALDVLRRAVVGGRSQEALYALGALAQLRSDDAFEFLCATLARSVEYADVAAGALARHGRPDAIPVLSAAVRRVPAWMRPSLAEAITMVREPDPRDALLRDWRLRYRRLPSLGWSIPPSWIQVATMVRPSRRQRPLGRASSTRLAARRYCEPAERRCRRCGGAIWEPTGLPICAHTAVAVMDLQRAFVRRWCRAGTTDVWDALDACDAADLARVTRRGSEEPGELAAAARATLYWSVSVGLEDLRAAVRHLRLVRRDVETLYARHAPAAPSPARRSATAPFRYPPHIIS